jgi:DNA polymerase III alpha subunit
MNNILNIFSSHYSIGKSIFTLDELSKDNPTEIKSNAPISILTIAKKYNLKEIYLRESDFSGFIQAYKNADAAGIELRFGIKLKVTDNVKEEKDKLKEKGSTVSFWIKNSTGYQDLVKMYSRAENGYLDWRIVQEFHTDNIIVSIPFYNSFLFRNNFKNGNCVPDFGQIKPIFELQSMGLPYDDVHRAITTQYALKHNLPIVETHLSYYYSTAHVKAYQIFRTICCKPAFEGMEKKSFNNPGLEHFCSNEFSFESYCSKTGLNFLN